MIQSLTARPRSVRFLALSLMLALGFAPIPAGWAALRAARDSARSAELNRADRQAEAGGYYEGLIGGGDGPAGSRGELALRLLGKPTEWIRFHDAKLTRQLPGDPLLFELIPGIDRVLYGHPFTTNAFGLRDREYSLSKPPGVYRVALLGSSMDMGWGIGTEDTYANLLEDWLNAHAARRGLDRRFEVLNFAVAAYAPAQRLETFRRKAAPFSPDLVLYSGTMLDPRLAEIHLCDLLRGRVEPIEPFLRRAIDDAGLTDDDLRLDARGELARKAVVKEKLKDQHWSLIDGALGALAAECRSRGVPLACLLIPRVGKADAADARALPVARYDGIAARHAVPLIDLTNAYDDHDPATLEIAAWDDHPNALGHRRLFLDLARTIVREPELYREFFGADPLPESNP